MLALAILCILLTWLIAATILIGIGAVLLRFLHIAARLSDSFWVGLAVCVVFLEDWHLLLPMTIAVPITLLIAGAAAVFMGRESLHQQYRSAISLGRGPVILFFVLTVFLAFRAAGPCSYYDTGLYGAAAVKWNQTYAAVPGLANLHGRLGFNSAVMLCVAAFGPADGRYNGFHDFPGLIVAAMWFSVLPAWLKAWRNHRLTPADWFLVVLAIPLTNWTLRWWIVGAVTDVPASMTSLLAVAITIDVLGSGNSSDATDRTGSRLVVAAALCALAVSFKLSAAAIAGGTWAAGFLWILRHRDMRFSDRQPRAWFVALAIVALVLIPWVFTNIITSGYPFYPSTILPAPVDWLVPAAQARWDADWIRSWARIPGAPLEKTAGWAWIPAWFNRSLSSGVSFTRPLLICLASVVAIAILRFALGRRRPDNGPWLWMLVPAMAGLGFWFWAAPDTRFGEGAIWATTGLLVVWTLSLVDWNRRPRLPRIVAVLIALAGLTALGSPQHLFHDQYQPVLAGNTFPPPLPRGEISVRVTRSGLRVYVPVTGDQTWLSALPNTPTFQPELSLRNPSDMRWGFTMQRASARIR